MMSDVWVVWPTANIGNSITAIARWHKQGYKVAILVEDALRVRAGFLHADMVLTQPVWEGFPKAANKLCRAVPGDVVVVVGDDVWPDPDKSAQIIAAEFFEQFPWFTGVMQPTGDKFGGTQICAVSPWIGREFINKAYGGKGPYWEGYYHYYSDHELQVIATELSVFQQRSDLTQYHDHWQRHKGEKRPRYLFEAENRWESDKVLFFDRKGRGFPNE